MAKILITGGSGLIGREISQLLSQEGHSVYWLSRGHQEFIAYKTFFWDGFSKIDPLALKEVEVVIHLAGAGVFDHKWTPSYKQRIMESRTKSTHFLMQSINQYGANVHTILGSSASGFYGDHLHAKPFRETDKAGTSFLAQVCEEWEQSYYTPFSKPTKLCIVRTGIVLSTKGGALSKLLPIFKWHVGAPLGSGQQVMPWIHIKDLARLYIHLIKHEENGVYNGAAPECRTNTQFSKTLAKSVSHGFMLPAVPPLVLRLFLGESADVLLKGVCLSTEKVEATGFNFSFPTLESAMKDLIG